jgi:hypothetical protein
VADYGPCCGKITEPPNYLPGALVADDDGRDWMIPIPAPPIAPASSPNKIRTGMLSSNEFFFAISEFLPELRLCVPLF